MSKLYDLLYSMIGKVNKSVKTETQVLTEEQKTQARANIGAMADTYTPPNQTAQQVGADPAGTAASVVSTHNTNQNAHSDIRTLINNLATKLNAIADSDDTTLDQLSEIVNYIKANKELIESVTTAKVSVADIIDDLTTTDSKKPLSANQGVVLKELIDSINTALANKVDLTDSEITTLSNSIQ